jgi:protein-tyrosine phosphatase
MSRLGFVVLLALAPAPLWAQKAQHIPLEGTPNFRDLGGYAVKGGVVKSGRVFRSGTLEKLTEKDLETLQKLGIKTVVDLRTQFEVDRAPDKLPKGVRYLHLPIGKDEDVKKYFEPKTAADVDALLKPGGFIGKDKQPGYDNTIARGDSYAKLMDLLTNPEHHPIVFHCTAGKDRTGVAAAVLLWTLGASDDTVAADYTLTDKYFKPEAEKRLAELRKKLAAIKKVTESEIDLSGMRERMGTRKETILGTRAKIEKECGGWEPFLEKTLKLTPARQKLLRDALVEPRKES